MRHSALIRTLWTTLTLLLCLPACYSSTAVKGTPIPEVPELQEKRKASRAERQENLRELADMSTVSKNDVFKTVEGEPEYRVGPLDVLEITSRTGSKAEPSTITVDNSGRISYSFVDDLKVSGLTPSEIDDLLTEKLSQYIRTPRIDVVVKKFNSKHALVLGEFTAVRGTTSVVQAASGEIPLKGKTSLMNLIASAGGYTVDADIKNVRLIREGRTYRINLFDIIEQGKEQYNVIIDDGDVVEIPELPEYGERVYVLGEVNYQGVYSLKDTQDLLAAVSLAGNVTRLAKEENTLVVRPREDGGKPLVMMADLKALLREADLQQNIPLQNGDLVYVPRMRIGDINDWIANTTPLLNVLLYPREFEQDYFMRRYLHIDRRHD